MSTWDICKRGLVWRPGSALEPGVIGYSGHYDDNDSP